MSLTKNHDRIVGIAVIAMPTAILVWIGSGFLEGWGAAVLPVSFWLIILGLPYFISWLAKRIRRIISGSR